MSRRNLRRDKRTKKGDKDGRFLLSPGASSAPVFRINGGVTRRNVFAAIVGVTRHVHGN